MECENINLKSLVEIILTKDIDNLNDDVRMVVLSHLCHILNCKLCDEYFSEELDHLYYKNPVKHYNFFFKNKQYILQLQTH